jgi:hypothetical protein
MYKFTMGIASYLWIMNEGGLLLVNKIVPYTLSAAMLALVLYATPAFAEHPGSEHPSTQQSELGDMQRSEQATPALTGAQKQELAVIYKEKEQLVGKYLEFGLITEEKAKNWTKRIREQHAKIEKSGFLPMWRNCDKKKED